MRNLFSTFILLLIISGCSTGDPTPGGGGGNQGGGVPLVVGDTEQSGVNYRASSGLANLAQKLVDGDSVFYEAAIDLDEQGSADLVFTLVKWTDFQVLTVKGSNGFSIPFTGSDVEIIEIERLVPEAKFLINGTTISSTTATNYTTEISAFATYTYQGEISILSELSFWNDRVYIPFQSETVEGWIGINAEVSSGVELTGIGIKTIAYRSK